MRWTKYRENQTRCIGKSDTVYWRIRWICIRYNLNPRSVHAIFQWTVYIQLLSDLNNFLDYSLSEWHFPFKVESKINSNFIFSNWGFILPDYFCHTKDGIIRLHSYLRASRKLNFKTWKGGVWVLQYRKRFLRFCCCPSVALVWKLCQWPLGKLPFPRKITVSCSETLSRKFTVYWLVDLHLLPNHCLAQTWLTYNIRLLSESFFLNDFHVFQR